jgi:putative flippase GtrA
MRHLLEQFLRFCGVGVLAAVGHYSVYIGLMMGIGTPPVPTSLVSYLVGGTISYLFSYGWVFASEKNHRVAVVQFVAVAGVGFGLTGICMAVLTGPIRVHWLLAQVLTSGVVMFWSFAANKLWTFSKPEPRV